MLISVPIQWSSCCWGFLFFRYTIILDIRQRRCLLEFKRVGWLYSKDPLALRNSALAGCIMRSWTLKSCYWIFLRARAHICINVQPCSESYFRELLTCSCLYGASQILSLIWSKVFRLKLALRFGTRARDAIARIIFSFFYHLGSL